MITVQNAQRKMPVDLATLRSFAERALALCLAEREPQPAPLRTLGEVHAVLVSDRRIAALHWRFMNIPGPTDVITFEHGEIVISTETAARQAQEFGTTTTAEIQLYLLHGLLHLRGFDDTTVAAAEQMRAVQTRLLAAAMQE